MEEYSFQRLRAGRESIAQIKAALKARWEGIPQELVNQYCMDFHDTLPLVIQNNGQNNFNK